MKRIMRIRLLNWSRWVLAGAAPAILAALIAAPPAWAAPAKPAESAVKAGTTANPGAPAAPIDINTADAQSLTNLPGIGPAIAQRIVDYRKEHGAFKTVDELLNVRGIGDRLLARIRDRVTVADKR